MTNVLDQDEVDELLSAIDNISVVKPGREGTGALRDYDFARPERFARDQVSAVRAAHETAASRISADLSTMLGASFECALSVTDQIRYGDFCMSLDVPTCAFVLNVSPMPGTAILVIDPAVAFAVVELETGGARHSAGAYVPHRAMSAFEMDIMRRVAQAMAAHFQEAWSDFGDVTMRVSDGVTDLQGITAIPQDSTVLLMVFDVVLGLRSGQVHLCVPASTFERAVAGLRPEVRRHSRATDEEGRDVRGVTEQMTEVSCDVTAVLAETRLSVRELLGLAPGDVVHTGKRADDEVDVLVEGARKFSGKIGQYRGKAAVQVMRPLR